MDIRTDLMKHFGAGMLIAVIIGIVAFCTHGNWLNVLLTSALCGVVANLAKEYADKNLSRLSLNELLALTRTSKSKIEDFLSALSSVTLNS